MRIFLAIVRLLLVAYLIICVWPTPYRYDHLGGTPVRWHRITDKMEYLNLNGWNDQIKLPPDQKATGMK